MNNEAFLVSTLLNDCDIRRVFEDDTAKCNLDKFISMAVPFIRTYSLWFGYVITPTAAEKLAGDLWQNFKQS